MNLLSKKWIRIVLIAVPIIAVVAALGIIQPWNISPDSGAILANAQTAKAKVDSYRMTLSGFDSSPFQGNAEFKSPGPFHLKIVSYDRVNEYINIDDTRYVKPGGRPINSSIGFSTSSVPDDAMTLKMLAQIIDIQNLKGEKIDGVSCFHYRGKEDIRPRLTEIVNSGQWTEEQMKQIIALVQSTQAEVQLWIGESDYLVRQMQLNIPEAQGPNNANFSLKYYDFNQPISVDPPLDANGQLLPGWQVVAQ